MLRYSKYLLAFAALSAKATPATQGPGMGISVSEDGVNKGINVIIPYIFKYIGDISVPEVDFDGGYLKNITMHIEEPKGDDVKLGFVHENNGAEFTVNNAEADLSSDFHYKWGFISVDGQAAIKINKAAIDIEIDTSTQESTPSYELAPKLDTKKFTIGLNPNDIDITLTGGLVAKIANILIPMLKNSVIPDVIKQVEQQIPTIINGQIDQDLKIYGSQQEIPFLGGVTADYAQVGGPQFTDSSIFQMGLNGTFFDANNVKAPFGSPAEFAMHDPQGKDAQFYLTDYTVMSALTAGFSTLNTLDLTYLLQEYLNITVTTDNLGVLIPEILTKYGSGKAVGLKGKFVTSPSSVEFTDGQASAKGNLQVTVTVDNEQAIEASFLNMNAVTALHTESGKLYGKLSPVSIGNIDPSSFITKLEIEAAKLEAMIQAKVDEVIEEINKKLTIGITIGKVDFDLRFHLGYVAIGASVNSTMWTHFSNFMHAWKAYVLNMQQSAPYSKIMLEQNNFIQF